MKVGSLFLLAVAALLSSMTTAHAQQNPPAALTVPMPLGPPPGTIDVYRRPDQFHNNPQPPPLPPVYIPGPGPYWPGYYPQDGYRAERLAQRGYTRALSGGLWLETQPDSAQVTVDGNYVGLVEDFGLRGRPMELRAGRHHVELRANGYLTEEFDVRIAANEIARYRGDLQALARPSAQPRAAAAMPSKKYYVIPNCYAGDRPPTRALRPGCSTKQMLVVSH